MNTIISWSCLFTIVSISVESAPPAFKTRNYLSLCRQSDPQFNECVRKEASSAGPYLAKAMTNAYFTILFGGCSYYRY